MIVRNRSKLWYSWTNFKTENFLFLRENGVFLLHKLRVRVVEVNQATGGEVKVVSSMRLTVY